MDSYACIMCFRCQEVCPAYNTGKLLCPAALEINKRYHLNQGGATDVAMLDLIPEEAVWACTSCGACVDICPVGNEPMRDILDIRRNLSMMESAFPKQLETAFKGMERNINPVERLPGGPHEVGGGVERADHRAEPGARHPVVGGLRARHGCPRPEDRAGLCQDPERAPG